MPRFLPGCRAACGNIDGIVIRVNMHVTKRYKFAIIPDCIRLRSRSIITANGSSRWNGVLVIINLTIRIQDGDAGEVAAARECRVSDARHATRDGDTGEAAAAPECIIPDARHAVRDGDALEIAAVIECILPDARHTVRDGDAREVMAAGKCSPPDARHAVRDGDALEAAAVIECPIPDARHAARNRDACEVMAGGKCRIDNADCSRFQRNPCSGPHASFIGIGDFSHIDNAVRLIIQPRRAVKCRIPDARHAIRNRDACEIAAVIECRIPYVCYAIRNNDACEAAAAGECFLADVCHAIRDGDACEIAAIRECRIGNADCSRFQRNPCSGRHAYFIVFIGIGDFSDIDNAVRLIVQPCRIVECFLANVRHAIRDGDAFETAATGECTRPDARHTVRDGDAGNAGTALKCIIIDACHSIRDNKVCNQFTVQIQLFCIIKRVVSIWAK